MDRFRARSLSRRTHLHLLGLFPSALAAGFGIAHRSSVAQRRPGAAPPQCRRRSLGPRPAPFKRPSARLVEVLVADTVSSSDGRYAKKISQKDDLAWLDCAALRCAAFFFRPYPARSRSPAK